MAKTSNTHPALPGPKLAKSPTAPTGPIPAVPKPVAPVRGSVPATRDTVTRLPAPDPSATRAELDAILKRGQTGPGKAKPTHPAGTGKLLSEENRHAVHEAHLKTDAARVIAELQREAPHAAKALLQVIEANPSLEASIIKSAVDLAKMAPDLATTLFKAITSNRLVGKVLLPRLAQIGQVFEKALAKTLANHPELGAKAAARIVGESLGRGIAKALPVVGVGLAVWGSKDAVEATLDPRVSRSTAGKYWKANALDWGSAIGGLLAETGIGEVAAIAAAVGSVFAYADAEASKMKDLGLTAKAH
ncbi:MAG: hypothetical protein VKP57_06540 [Candidatus Sericytochromatia bacterium]|nr:hypothetical protein [Candidatus Sericytochromatia bacterium]